MRKLGYFIECHQPEIVLGLLGGLLILEAALFGYGILMWSVHG